MKHLKSFENISEKEFKINDTIICLDGYSEDDYPEDEPKSGQKYIVVDKKNTPDFVGIKIKKIDSMEPIRGYWNMNNFVYEEDYDTYINTNKYNL